MLPRLHLIVALCLLLLTAGCGGDTRKAVANDALDVLEDYVKVMRTVKDEPSAKAAVAELDELTARLTALSARFDKLPPDAAVADEVFIRRFNNRMKTATASLANASRRIASNPAIRQHIAGPIQRMNQAASFAKFAPPAVKANPSGRAG